MANELINTENKIDWKSVLKEVFDEVFDEIKDNAITFIKNEALPAAKAAKEDFFTKLDNESLLSKSLWLKIRNAGIKTAVNITGTFSTKAIEKFDNK